MAKWSRRQVGSIIKSKDDRPDYIKFSEDVVFKKGDTLSLESKKSQLASLEKAIEEKRLGGEAAAKARARIDSTPDWVRFQVIQVKKLDG